MIPYILLTLASGLSAFFVFLLFLRQGQFEDCEEVKYQLFHEEEE